MTTVCHPRNLRVVVPIRTVSGANAREHWAVKAKRARAERRAVLFAVRPLLIGEPPDAWLPCVVTLVRIAPRRLDSDNLARSQKAVRDQVACELGVDDRDPRVTWLYAQRSGRAREYAVEITIKRDAP